MLSCESHTVDIEPARPASAPRSLPAATQNVTSAPGVIAPVMACRASSTTATISTTMETDIDAAVAAPWSR